MTGDTSSGGATPAPRITDTLLSLSVPPNAGHLITCERLRALHAWWAGLPRSGTLPRRAEIDPTDIPDLLAHFFIYDVIGDPPDYRMRLAGTQLCSLARRELRGLWFDDIHPPDVAEVVRREFDHVVASGCPHFAARSGRWRDDAPLPYRRLALPFADDGERVDCLAGASLFEPSSYLWMDYYRAGRDGDGRSGASSDA